MTEWDVIYYFQAGCLEDRDMIADKLEAAGFKWIEMVNGQAAFAVNGEFRLFCDIVLDTASEHDIDVSRLMACPYPGVGLFTPECD